jgi:hypothetical protein
MQNKSTGLKMEIIQVSEMAEPEAEQAVSILAPWLFKALEGQIISRRFKNVRINEPKRS